MDFRCYSRLSVSLLLFVLLLFAASCGGGGSDTQPVLGGTINSGDTVFPPLDIDGPTVYSGKPDTDVIADGGAGDGELGALGKIGDFGPNIYPVPLDSNGVGRITANQFMPGQRVAFVMINLNRAYLDAHANADRTFPPLPESSFTVQADLVNRGSLSSISPAEAVSADPAEFGTTAYNGVGYSPETISPMILHAREAEARGVEPFAPEVGAKTTTSIQKGEVRCFVNVQPRAGVPPVPPDPEDPEQDTSDFEWPPGYANQFGRVVATGAHCIIYLTTDINNGHPDSVQFTEARLNRMAREFDTVIYPTNTTAFAPVVSYAEQGIWMAVSRFIDPPITGADFGDDGQITRFLPGEPDLFLEQEEKIHIFIYDGEDGGFYVPGNPNDDGEYGEPHPVGSAIYIGSDNYPVNDSGWEAAYSVMAHEFQHKLFNDHALPRRPVMPLGGNYNWFNEGMSQLAIHLNGYTANSGRIINWAIDGQLTDYLTYINRSAVPMDGNSQFPNGQQTQYGSGFLFFLYLYEHYDPGVGTRIYSLAKSGEEDFIKLVEFAARTTEVTAGPDEIMFTEDDVTTVYHDTFANLYTKFMIANFVDGIYAQNETGLFDPRFQYNSIDLRGTVNLSTGTIVLPGVRTEYYPASGTYPVEDIDRLVFPWAADFLVFSNGDGRDLNINVYSDPNFRMYMLPVHVGDPEIEFQGGFEDPNKVYIDPRVTIN